MFPRDVDDAMKAKAHEVADVQTRKARAVWKSCDAQVQPYVLATLGNELVIEIARLKVPILRRIVFSTHWVNLGGASGVS